MINIISNTLAGLLGPSYTVKVLALLTLLGVWVAALKLVFDSDPHTNPDWNTVWPATTLAWSQLYTRANKVSSEQAAAASPAVAAAMSKPVIPTA